MKKGKTSKTFSILILTAMLVCSAILPVCAEEAAVFESVQAEETLETEEPAGVAESAEIEVNAETAEVPRVTVSSIEWKGGYLRVPASLGDYAVDDLRLEVMVNGQRLTSIMNDYRNLITEDYIDIPLLEKENYFNNTFDISNFAKVGNYAVTVIFLGSYQTDLNGKEISRSEFTIEVKKESRPWSFTDETVSFDGSQDAVFHFKNGTNYFELESMYNIIEIGNSKVFLFSDTNEFSYDMSAGTVTLHKNALKKALAEHVKDGTIIDKMPVWASSVIGSAKINLYDGFDKCLWWLDVSNLDLDSIFAWWESPFTDVTVDNWYYDAAGFVYERGIMTGMNETEFGPGVKLSRAQFATILYRMEGEPEAAYDPSAFPDVADGQFYTAAAMWAKSTGVISGYEDGRFGPADEITREQMAVMMYRYANMLGLDTSMEGDMSGFPDAGQISPFADKEMKWAVGKGLVRGNGGMVDSQGQAERAQCATIIMRFMEGYRL